MKSLLKLAVLIFFSIHFVFGQSCSVVINSQADIDNFATNYPGCTQITGNLVLAGSGITNVNGLSQITSIGGFLSVYQTGIVNFQGLQNLTTVGGGIGFNQNAQMTQISGLNSLTTINGSINIVSNVALTSVTGFNGLTTLSGGLEISGNLVLPSITGFTGLTTLGSLSLTYNPQLVNIAGLSQVTSIISSVNFTSNPQINLTTLNQITTINGHLTIGGTGTGNALQWLNTLISVVGDLYVSPTDIVTFSGFPNLTTVGGNMYIQNSSQMTNISGFNSLTSVGGLLRIWSNAALTSVSGFNALTSVNALNFMANPQLVNVTGFNALTTIHANFEVVNNAKLVHLNGISALNIVKNRITIENNPLLDNIDNLSSLTQMLVSHVSTHPATQGIISIKNNAALKNINGLNNLSSGVASLLIINNSALQYINGLNFLQFAYTVEVSNNAAMTYIAGFNGMTEVRNRTHNVVLDSIVIKNNAALSNVNAFNNATYCGAYISVTGNPLLTHLQGWNLLKEVSPFMKIQNNASLTTITAFSQLKLITTDFTFKGNNALTNLSAFPALKYIGNQLRIENNTSLSTVSGLNNLFTVAHLSILSNPSLNSIIGFHHPLTITGNLDISQNPLLSNCSVEAVCAALCNPRGTITIGGNGANCTSAPVVQAACGACAPTKRLYVNKNVVGGNGSGNSWANAFVSLSDALWSIRGGGYVTEIWIAAGTYLPTRDFFGDTNPADNRLLTFAVPPSIVKIYGGFAGNETNLSQRNLVQNEVVLSGNINTPANTDNCYAVMTYSGAQQQSLLEGVTVSDGGLANYIYNQYYSYTYRYDLPYAAAYRPFVHAAILHTAYSKPSYLKMKDCVVKDNAFHGVQNYGNGAEAILEVEGGKFLNNAGHAVYLAAPGINGSTWLPSQSTGTFSNVHFENNARGIMLAQAAPVNVSGCVFKNQVHAGIQVENGYGNLNVSNSFFTQNQGYSIIVYYKTANIDNCVFANNQAAAIAGMKGSVKNSTFYGNVGGSFTGYSSGNLLVSNSIFWSTNNTNHFFLYGNTGYTFSHCVINGTIPPNSTATNILTSNPQFVNPADPDGADNIWGTADDGLKLSACSPAINAGNNASVTQTVDAANTPRIQQTTVDIGAYESNGTAQIACTNRLYVNKNAICNGSGTSWANPIQELGEALWAAQNCNTITEIWVAAGTYLPTRDTLGNANPSNPSTRAFKLKNGVAIYGGFNGTETALTQRNVQANVTILSGEIGNSGISDNISSIVMGSNTNATAQLNGFTLSRGVEAIRNWVELLGKVASPTVSLCTFSQNSMAVLNWARNGSTVSPTFSKCQFLGNGYSSAMGGAVANYSNSAPAYPNTYSTISPSFTDCVFDGNMGMNGGAVYNENFCGYATPSFVNCVFVNNTGDYGGAIHNYRTSCGLSYSNAQFTNCTFTQNSADYAGGAIYESAVASDYPSTLKNCILWGNTAVLGAPNRKQMHLFSAGNSVSHCLIEGGLPLFAVNNGGLLTTNPLFVNASNPKGTDNQWATADDGLRLSACSPAINAGKNANVTALNDILGMQRTQQSTVDMGAYESELAPNAFPNRIYVNKLATGANTGMSWADAFTELRDAFSTPYATCVDEIWVAKGTYKPVVVTNRGATFNMPNGVKVYGGFIGGETLLSQRNFSANPTIISGNIGSGSNFDNSYHVITAQNVDADTRLDGFFIQGGNANGTGASQNTGGGIWCNNAAMTVANCVFTDNQAVGNGGAISNFSSSTNIINCVFEKNTATANGGIVYNEGSPILIQQSRLTTGAAANGAAIYNNFSNIRVENTLISNNNASVDGGAIFSEFSTSTYLNTLLVNNSALSNGGALYNTDGGDVLINVTCYGNQAAIGGAYAGDGSALEVKNSIIWGNTAPTNPVTSMNGGGSIDMQYTNVQGGYTGTGNLNQNPLFVDVSDKDGADNIWFTQDDGLNILCGSAMSEAGNSAFLPADVSDMDNDLNVTEATPWDITASPRVAGASVAMGAYENSFTFQQPRIYVNHAATGNNNGTSWANAYLSLADALDNANNCNANANEIWVAQGVYTPTFTNDRTKTFALRSNLKVYGGFVGTENTLNQRNIANNPTYLSGEIGSAGVGDNSYHIVSAAANVNNTALLDGFIIGGGNANGTGNQGNGGAVWTEGSPVINNCKVINNTGVNGGAVFVGGSGLPAFTFCDFIDNQASQEGGAIYLGSANASVLAFNNIFSQNEAGTNGGAISNQNNYSCKIVNCIFENNLANGLTLSTGKGGAIYTGTNAETPIYYSTFSHNNANNQGGAICNDGQTEIYGCIVWGNVAANGNEVFGSATVSYSNIQGGFTGTANLNTNPFFAESGNGIGNDGIWRTDDDGYKVNCGSPVLNMASNFPSSDNADLDGDGNINEVVPYDVLGNARVSGGIADMGAYEGVSLNGLSAVTGSNANVTATSECADGDWTHYIDLANGWIVLSLKKNGEVIGEVGDGTFEVKSYTTSNWGSNTATEIQSSPPNYINNATGWYVMNRYWEVIPKFQPNNEVGVKMYFTQQDVNDVNGSIVASGAQPLSIEDLRFYKINGTYDPNPANGHVGIPAAADCSQTGYWEYIHGVNAPIHCEDNNGKGQWKKGTLNNFFSAQYLVASFSGGGGGGAPGGGGAFPVTLTSFTASPKGNIVETQWSTSMEVNSDYFTVERSKDLQSFVPIGQVKAAGNAQSPLDYQWDDTQPLVGKSYYRLRSTDIDGKTQVSSAVEVYMSHEGWSVYPNPTQGDFVIETDMPLTVTIFAVDGKILQTQTLTQGRNTLSLTDYAYGVYFLQMSNGETVKIIKE